MKENISSANKRKLEKGFTLIEIVVALAIFSVLSLGVISLVSSIFTDSNKQANLLSEQDQARKVAFQIINEFRNAQTGNDGAYSINQAGDQQIIFFSNLSNNGSIVTRVRYYLLNGILYRGTITPTGSPLGYVPGNEVVMAVQNNVANASAPLFYYYDGNYNASTVTTPLAQPVNLNSVKFIKLNLMIYNKAGVAQSNSYTVSIGGAIRNLKNNLGN